MPRPRKSENQLNIDLPIDLLKELDRFCDDNGLKKKRFVEWALRALLKEKKR